MTAQIHAPWTPEQVAALNRFQLRGGMHPFTCGADHAGPSPALVARADGWHCPGTYRAPCDYRQDWAHAFMADPNAWPKPFADLRKAAATEATEPETKCGPACIEQHTYRLDGCALCCVEMHGSVAQPAWAVPCPDRRCQAPADRPCLRSDGSPAGVCHPARFTALDQARTPTPPQDVPHEPQDGPQRPDAAAETPDGAGGRQTGTGGRETLREQYAAAIEADAERPRDERVGIINAVLAVRDRELEQLRARLDEAQQNALALDQGREELFAVIRGVRTAVHVTDDEDVTDWQRGYRACSERALAALDQPAAGPAAIEATEAGERS